MANINVLNQNGEVVSNVELNDSVWAIEPNQQAMFDAVMVYRNSTRQATAKTKTRSEVRGGGKKPWRQKGTGRARQGSIRAPQWRGGGIVFGPTPRSYNKKQNKKERRLALLSALSSKVEEKGLFMVDALTFENAKTKEAVAFLNNLKLTGLTLVVVDELTDEAILAFRNIRDVKLIAAHEINTIDVVGYKNLVMTEAAVKKLEEVLA